MAEFQVKRFDRPRISRFQLCYYGRDADAHRLDMYDASASFRGFARTVAVVGHFYSTGRINAHAPRSEVRVYLEATEEGSLKQTVLAAAVTAIVSTPLAVFISRALESWIPPEDAETQQIIELLQEQNELLRENPIPPDAHSGADEAEEDKPTQDNIDEANRFIDRHQEQLDVLRSVTSNSFKDVFRPVGRSADFVGLTAGTYQAPIGAVNKRALDLIEADRPDEETILIKGIVSSFSRSSKTGIVFSPDVGRGFRIEYKKDGRLPAEDAFSWSQYYQRPIRMTGRFVRFYDGTIKKFLVYAVEKIDITNIE